MRSSVKIDVAKKRIAIKTNVTSAWNKAGKTLGILI